MERWVLVHEAAPYRDYEPEHSAALNGWSRITFVDDQHRAYASVFNPSWRPDNNEDITTGEEVQLSWDEAERLVIQGEV